MQSTGFPNGLNLFKQHEKLDTAVELLGKALHIRIKAHGGQEYVFPVSPPE